SPKKDLSLDDYKKLARDVGRLFWVDIGGGEPFLRKDLADIVAIFDAKVITIPSNGSLPDLMENQLTRMRELSDAELVLSLSLDGLEATHDRIRNQPSNWKQIWKTFDRLRRLDWLTIKINTVLNADNEGEIIEMMQVVRKRNPDFHSIILLRGEPANSAMKLPPMARLRELGPEMYAILELKTIEEQRQVVPCIAGKGHMVVMGDGSVSSCEMLPTVGNIKTNGINEIRASKAFLDQKRSIANKECHCTHNCALLHSIFFNPASLPHLMHTKIERA
ncbi:MAG: radical SAM protein, partial [Rhodospirillales bacterium]|nr:radical SAM protein [Rhodospirillales bacterium]